MLPPLALDSLLAIGRSTPEQVLSLFWGLFRTICGIMREVSICFLLDLSLFLDRILVGFDNHIDLGSLLQ